MGMGHRIYRVRDPRALVLEKAIERLLGHASGIIGFPLRLLARVMWSGRRGPELREAAMTWRRLQRRVRPARARRRTCPSGSRPSVDQWRSGTGDGRTR